VSAPISSRSTSGVSPHHTIELVVQPGQTLTLDFTLEVGALTKGVKVTAEVPLLQAASAEISHRAAKQRDRSGLVNLDLAIAKTWPLGMKQIEMRWEVFNALNAVNLDLPNRIFGTRNFGRIFSAKSPREMQLGAKITL